MWRSSSSALSARRRSSSQRGDSGTKHQVRRGSPQRKATVYWKLIQSGSRKATRPLLASPRAKGMAIRLLNKHCDYAITFIHDNKTRFELSKL